MLRKNNGYMPDVLDCLANLSNDEVFTPPEVANKMLDLLPQELFESKDTKFLDPFTKSGVFLREITKRLLRNQLPDYETVSSEIDIIEKEAIQNAVKNNELDLNDPYYSEKARKIGHDAVERHERAEEFNLFERRLQRELNRIFSTQVFGIAITELTAQLARRSLYCSKNAAGKYSVSSEFDTEEGNIRFKPMKHTWKDGSCIHCGANENMFDRPDDFEQHAYEFIHNEKVEDIFMGFQFDAIVGNPPYHSKVGEVGNSAIPIYQHFVEKAKMLNPRYLTMIIPARWFAGGRGLDSFRDSMLNDNHIKVIYDYFDSNDCFPGVDISGGICYFLRDKDYIGDCQVTNVINGVETTKKRPLKEKDIDVFVRVNQSINILQKVKSKKEESFYNLVSAVNPFGFTTTYNGSDSKNANIKVFSRNKTILYCEEKDITTNIDKINKYKIFIATAYGERGKFPYFVTPKPFPGEKKEICTGTYLLVGSFEDKEKRNNALKYMNTKFFRFMVLLKKNTQHAPRGTYEFVPVQDFSKPWTDEELYKKYNLTQEEIDFIESMIKPMGDNIPEKTEAEECEEDGGNND